MTNQQILQKAIAKAIDGGWVDGKPALEQLNNTNDYAIPVYATQFIYSHDFAKALWGDGAKSSSTVIDGQEYEIKTPEGIKYLPKKAWQYHLQQMVIAEDPIKYLGDNI